MWPSLRQQDYHAVADDDILDESQFPTTANNEKRSANWMRKPWTWPTSLRMPFLILIVLAVLAIIGSLVRPKAHTFSSHATTQPDSENASTWPVQPQPSSMPKPISIAINDPEEPSEPQKPRCSKRREWRTLERDEQQAYIDATLCLRNLYPSNPDLETNYTGYDDFPWIDAHHGYATWGVASYLPWHRYFLHLYERALRQRCGYHGSLVYWDWTLDYQDFTKSPVLDPVTGFGGDGEVNGQVTAGYNGRCVMDGPFAGIQAEFWNGEVFPHCLSRGFSDLQAAGGDIHPESVEELLKAPTYEQFVADMEERIRDTIPRAIGGEFDASTASYDPLFFLHFTQIDRIWWMWQQRQPNLGLLSYGGQREPGSFDEATLEDELGFGGLGRTVKVKDVLDTGRKDLCYRY